MARGSQTHPRCTPSCGDVFLDIGLQPPVPETEAENERLLAIAKALLDKPKLTREEKQRLELVLPSIKAFEDAHYFTKPATLEEYQREMKRAHRPLKARGK